MPLLGFLAAGAANSYAQMKNAETDTQNKANLMLFQQEMENDFRERLAERQLQNGIVRDQLKQGEVRKTNELQHSQNLEVKDKEYQNRLKVEQAKGGIQRSNELLKQDRADARSKANITSRKEIALLNQSDKSPSSTGGLSIKDLTKSIENDRKEIFNAKKDLADPLKSGNPQMNALLKEKIKELEGRVVTKIKQMNGVNETSNLSSSMQNLYNSAN